MNVKLTYYDHTPEDYEPPGKQQSVFSLLFEIYYLFPEVGGPLISFANR
jgi:hypothetical protein